MWCEYYGAPPLGEPLLMEPDRSVHLLNDYGHYTAWNDWCGKHLRPRKSNIHRHRPFGSRTAILAWQEPSMRFAVEVILHSIGDERLGLEFDFDGWNPGHGIGPSLLHGLLVLWHKITGGVTDSFAVATYLRKRGMGVADARVDTSSATV